MQHRAARLGDPGGAASTSATRTDTWVKPSRLTGRRAPSPPAGGAVKCSSSTVTPCARELRAAATPSSSMSRPNSAPTSKLLAARSRGRRARAERPIGIGHAHADVGHLRRCQRVRRDGRPGLGGHVGRGLGRRCRSPRRPPPVGGGAVGQGLLHPGGSAALPARAARTSSGAVSDTTNARPERPPAAAVSTMLAAAAMTDGAGDARDRRRWSASHRCRASTPSVSASSAGDAPPALLQVGSLSRTGRRPPAPGPRSTSSCLPPWAPPPPDGPVTMPPRGARCMGGTGASIPAWTNPPPSGRWCRRARRPAAGRRGGGRQRLHRRHRRGVAAHGARVVHEPIPGKGEALRAGVAATGPRACSCSSTPTWSACARARRPAGRGRRRRGRHGLRAVRPGPGGQPVFLRAAGPHRAAGAAPRAVRAARSRTTCRRGSRRPSTAWWPSRTCAGRRGAARPVAPHQGGEAGDPRPRPRHQARHAGQRLLELRPLRRGLPCASVTVGG